MEEASLIEGKWSCYSGHYNGGRMVVTEVASINEGCHFNGGRKVMSEMLMEY